MATVDRYLVEIRPKRLTPFRKGWQYNRRLEHFERVWVKNARRVFVTNRGFYALTHGGGSHGLLTPAEKDKAVAHFRKKGYAVSSTLRKVELYPRLTGDTDCNPDLLKALDAVAKDLGVTIHINSGLRTFAEQAVLYQLYLDGKGPVAAKPGQSNHNFGKAADCAINGQNMLDFKGVREACERHNICFPVPGEKWHAEIGDTWAN